MFTPEIQFDVLALAHHGAGSDYAPAQPPCTCERIDVDRYDVSGCELCNPRSLYNRMAARPAIDAAADVQPAAAIASEWDAPLW